MLVTAHTSCVLCVAVVSLQWPDSILFPGCYFKTTTPSIQWSRGILIWRLKRHMVHELCVQVSSTSVWSPPALGASSVFSETRSRPPWQWQWVWTKWCAPTVLWSIPNSPPLLSVAWTCRSLKSFLQPKQNASSEQHRMVQQVLESQTSVTT